MMIHVLRHNISCEHVPIRVTHHVIVHTIYHMIYVLEYMTDHMIQYMTDHIYHMIQYMTYHMMIHVLRHIMWTVTHHMIVHAIYHMIQYMTDHMIHEHYIPPYIALTCNSTLVDWSDSIILSNKRESSRVLTLFSSLACCHILTSCDIGSPVRANRK